MINREQEMKDIRSSIKDEKTLNERIKEEKKRRRVQIEERLTKVIERIKKDEILKKQLEEEIKNV